MNSLKLLLLPLLVLVVLFLLFSLSSFADEESDLILKSSIVGYENSDIIFSPDDSINFAPFDIYKDFDQYYTQKLEIYSSSGSSIVSQGDYFNLSIENIYVMHIQNIEYFYFNNSAAEYREIVLTSIYDETITLSSSDFGGIITDMSEVNKSHCFSLSYDKIEAPFDIKNISILSVYDCYEFKNDSGEKLGDQGSVNGHTIFHGLRDGRFSFSTESPPPSLVSDIMNGLKSIFIPSAQSITIIHNKWSSLLLDRFGVLYQAPNLVFEWVGSFKTKAAQKSIHIPEVTIPLPEDNEFTFGGWDVDLVPKGFEFLVEILKKVISIVCTIAFINSLKNRYDKFMGRE